MSWRKQLAHAIAAFGLLGCSASGQAFLSEILLEPLGPDLPNQYIELRGVPNYVFPTGTYVVSVAGDLNADPGTIENVFNLSGGSLSGNGFVVLLQKGNTYSVSSNATILVNTGTGDGFGSGGTSSIRHRGHSGRVDLPHASVTFFLIRCTNAPVPGTDIDGNDEGVPGGQTFLSWEILDSIGIVKDAGDITYGAINFRQGSSGGGTGPFVPVFFTPDYVARTGNSTNSEAISWLASGSLGGQAPNWRLSIDRTLPAQFSGMSLDHLGLPNFGAAPAPGVVAIQSGGSTRVLEGSGSDSYFLGLNTPPTGAVVIQLSAIGQAQISLDGGNTFSNSNRLSLTNDARREVIVKAPSDNVIGNSPYFTSIRHSVISTEDPAQYPVAMLTPEVPVIIIEPEPLLLNEVKVNPPGTNDAPCEFVELRGPPGALLTNIYLLGVDGDHGRNPGEVTLAADLTGLTLGISGLLVLTAENSPYTVSTNTTIFGHAALNLPGGALKNPASSLLLLASPIAVGHGTDLDAGDNGVLEGLPLGITLWDAVGWSDGNPADVLYGGVALEGLGWAPDALARFPTNSSPLSAQAWYFGELAAGQCSSTVFDGTAVDQNFPGGVTLSPGTQNTVAVQITPPGPLSGVIGDPGNPAVSFRVAAEGTNPELVLVTASSSNPDVVPDSNLVVAVAGAEGERTLHIDPVGVGYATITISARAGNDLGQIAFPYAASAMGRPGGLWHTGTADSSTAIALGPDYMLVGDNENNVIRLYDRRRSGAPITGVDFNQDLGLTLQEHGEVNIEASTRSGNRICFLGAHSNSNAAESRTNRNRLFAVDLSGSGTNTTLDFAGRYDYLKPDLVQWDSTNGHGKGSNYLGFAASAEDNVNPKAPDGFNIEGLSMAPGSTNVAWIGFRAPIVPATNRTYALIVPVLNFGFLAAQGGPPGSARFGLPIELDLYNRGIRSLEGGTNGFMICGGPPGNVEAYPNDFRLYTWAGHPADQPQQRAADLAGTLPEGMAELPPGPWGPGTQVQLISDHGTLVLYNDGIENKHLPIPAFRKFRTDLVALGAAVKPAPILVSTSLNGTNVSLVWRALKGEAYRVQFKPSLAAVDWSDVTADIIATGPYARADLPRTQESQGFYRVSLSW